MNNFQLGNSNRNVDNRRRVLSAQRIIPVQQNDQQNLVHRHQISKAEFLYMNGINYKPDQQNSKQYQVQKMGRDVSPMYGQQQLKSPLQYQNKQLPARYVSPNPREQKKNQQPLPSQIVQRIKPQPTFNEQQQSYTSQQNQMQYIQQPQRQNSFQQLLPTQQFQDQQQTNQQVRQIIIQKQPQQFQTSFQNIQHLLPQNKNFSTQAPPQEQLLFQQNQLNLPISHRQDQQIYMTQPKSPSHQQVNTPNHQQINTKVNEQLSIPKIIIKDRVMSEVQYQVPIDRQQIQTVMEQPKQSYLTYEMRYPNEINIQIDNLSVIQDPDTSEFMQLFNNESHTIIVLHEQAEYEQSVELASLPPSWKVVDLIRYALNVNQVTLKKPAMFIMLGKAAKTQLSPLLSLWEIMKDYPGKKVLLIEDII